MAKLIDGKKIANDIQEELKREILKWCDAGNRAPQLTAVLVGDDPASDTYVKNKMKAAQNVGIESITVKIPATISENELLQKIEELNNDRNIDGILVNFYT